MTAKAASPRRPTSRTVPVLTRTPVGRRSFVLRLVHDRAVRAARAPTTVSKA
jgi:hypothetical protein